MPAKGKNYLTLERFSLRYLFYAFLDTGDYLADGLFIQHQVTVKFLQEYGHDDSPYLVIFCRIRKRDEAAFLDALEELPNKMLICGHPDYPSQCQTFMDKINASQTEERVNVHDTDGTT
jgi:hypothetical protein